MALVVAVVIAACLVARCAAGALRRHHPDERQDHHGRRSVLASPQAVAVRGDRIVAVGTNQDITQLAGPKTRRIDLRGRSVVPGMIDNHAHFQEEGAYWTLELRFDGVDSRKQALEMIRAKAKAARSGQVGVQPRRLVARSVRRRQEAVHARGTGQGAPPTTRSSSSSARRRSSSTARRSTHSARAAQGRRGSCATRRGARPASPASLAATRCSTRPGFLDAPNGGKANLPMDVIVASQKVMLRDLAKAGLTASGGQCLWEDLYRQFQKEGTASMRFFCQKTAAGGRTRRRRAGEDDRRSLPDRFAFTTATSGWTTRTTASGSRAAAAET